MIHTGFGMLAYLEAKNRTFSICLAFSEQVLHFRKKGQTKKFVLGHNPNSTLHCHKGPVVLQTCHKAHLHHQERRGGRMQGLDLVVMPDPSPIIGSQWQASQICTTSLSWAGSAATHNLLWKQVCKTSGF